MLQTGITEVMSLQAWRIVESLELVLNDHMPADETVKGTGLCTGSLQFIL